jgi:hypothetical protein
MDMAMLGELLGRETTAIRRQMFGGGNQRAVTDLTSLVTIRSRRVDEGWRRDKA